MPRAKFENPYKEASSELDSTEFEFPKRVKKVEKPGELWTPEEIEGNRLFKFS